MFNNSQIYVSDVCFVPGKAISVVLLTIVSFRYHSKL